MKKLFTTLYISLTFGLANSQTILDSTTYYQTIKQLRDTLSTQIRDSGRLVSEYTFRSLVRNDYAILITGDKNKNTLGRYATIDINKDEQKVSLTPVTFITGNDPLNSAFHWIHSIDIEASINSKKIFNFDDRRKVSAGYSFSYVNSGFWFSKPQKPLFSTYDAIYDGVYNHFDWKYSSSTSLVDSIDNESFAGNERKLRIAYLEKVKDYENSLTNEIWNWKYFWWLKGNINPISWDVFNIVDMFDSNTYSKPISKAIYNPSAQLSGNFYIASKRRGSIYFNLSIKGSIKHTLSEISTTSEWQMINRLSDSVYTINETQTVYLLEDQKLDIKFLPDFSFQMIYILPENVFGKFTPGFDFSTSFNALISGKSNSGIGWVNLASIGLILPLIDKEGENRINIVPFYQLKSFIDIDKSSSNIWGIRFNLPFNKLF